MTPSEFASFHGLALEAQETRHSLLLTMIARLSDKAAQGATRFWTLGEPGQCAMQSLGFPIVLGNVTSEQCSRLAEITLSCAYPGVVGPDETARQFAAHAKGLGVTFVREIPQQIQELRTDPKAPDVEGVARLAAPEDFELFREWTLAFIREAVPDDQIPSDEALRATLAQRRHFLWFAGGAPVSMAAIARRTRAAATINSVFTPARYRNNGFAGAVTAAAVRQIFREGRSAACLYTDLRNPASYRCYAKLGFRRVCDSWHLIRSG